MKLSDSDRQQLFERARSINENLGSLFQNPMEITIGMIDAEFDQVKAFEAEISSYKDQLNRLKSLI